jgi:N6-L-threonylcarbamoyladenine synthase
MKILTIETTCDETAAAVVTGDLEVLASTVASQEELHLQFNGVVPEIAARAHVDRILPVIHKTLEQANTGLEDLDAIAVATTPGLAGSLLVGLVAAKSLCLATGLPLISINHLHAHIYACRIDAGVNVFPCLGLVISGGHSHLFRYTDALSAELLGGTIDDAAGEAFDKVASMLGLGYPGGPAISRVAENGDEKAYNFPRSFFRDPELKFSFSGLKTAVRYSIAGQGKLDFSQLNLDEKTIANVAASFQRAVVDIVVRKCRQALDQTQLKRLCVGGGVAANRVLRAGLKDLTEELDVQLHIAPMHLCTDNAVMGAIAVEKFNAGLFETLDLDIQPGLIR